MNTQKKSLIFDLDGTLVDTRSLSLLCINHTLSQVGEKNIEYQDLLNVMGVSLEETFRSILAKNKWGLVNKCVNLHSAFQRNCPDIVFSEISLYPSVKETLQTLSPHYLSIATNKPTWFAKHILSLLGIEQLFFMIVGIDDVSRNKPSPDMIFLILSNTPNINSAMMIGDSATDVQAGKKAEILTCAVEYGYHSKEILEREHPDFIVSRFSDLIQILSSST